MSRPSLTDITHGEESWDATVNDNHDVLTAGPFPIKEGDPADFAASAYDNCLMVKEVDSELFKANGGDWYTYGPGLPDARGTRCLVKTVSTTLVGLSGATATWTAAFPVGVIQLGVAGKVSVDVAGATSFDVGDGTDVDRYAAAVPISADPMAPPVGEWGTVDATANPMGWAAGDVVLTANGGSFSAGSVRLFAFYIEITPPTLYF
jgi:hypothetical protein